jgi:hypothetical protein
MKTSADRAAARSKSRPRASISYPQRWRRTRRKAKAIRRLCFTVSSGKETIAVTSGIILRDYLGAILRVRAKSSNHTANCTKTPHGLEGW